MNRKVGLKLTILLFSFYQMSMLGIPIILTDIAKGFPDYSFATIQLLATVPDLVIMLTSLFTGFLFSRISKKSISLCSCIFFIIAGIGGCFIHKTFEVLLLWSIFIGIGIGLLLPTVVAIINENYEGIDKIHMLGLQNMFVSLGAIICTLLFGWFSTYSNWNISYLLYSSVFLVFIFILIFIPKTKLVKKKKQKISISLVLKYSMLALLFFSVYNAIPVNLSSYLNDLGFSNTLLTSIGTCILLLGSVISGYFFDRIFKKFYKKTMLLGFLCLGCGLCMLIIVNNIYIVMIGLLISGMGLSIVMASCTNNIMEKEKIEVANLSIAIMMAASDGGGFVTSGYTYIEMILFSTHSTKNIFIICISILLICCIITIILKLIKRNEKIINDKAA